MDSFYIQTRRIKIKTMETATIRAENFKCFSVVAGLKMINIDKKLQKILYHTIYAFSKNAQDNPIEKAKTL